MTEFSLNISGGIVFGLLMSEAVQYLYIPSLALLIPVRALYKQIRKAQKETAYDIQQEYLI